jgi:hypothetical protein
VLDVLFLCFSVNRRTKPKNRCISVPEDQELIFSVSVLSVPVPGSFGSVPGLGFLCPGHINIGTLIRSIKSELMTKPIP